MIITQNSLGIDGAVNYCAEIATQDRISCFAYGMNPMLDANSFEGPSENDLRLNQWTKPKTTTTNLKPTEVKKKNCQKKCLCCNCNLWNRLQICVQEVKALGRSGATIWFEIYSKTKVKLSNFALVRTTLPNQVASSSSSKITTPNFCGCLHRTIRSQHMSLL